MFGPVMRIKLVVGLVSVSGVAIGAVAVRSYFKQNDSLIKREIANEAQKSIISQVLKDDKKQAEVQKLTQSINSKSSQFELQSLQQLSSFKNSKTKSLKFVQATLDNACHALKSKNGLSFEKIREQVCTKAKVGKFLKQNDNLDSFLKDIPAIDIKVDAKHLLSIVSDSRYLKIQNLPRHLREHFSYWNRFLFWFKGKDHPLVCKNEVKLNPKQTSTTDDVSNQDLYTTRDAEIDALATELGDAKGIFYYVRDQIKFLPRFGLTQTAKQVLHSKAGTAADKSALLIALLRSKNIPARFIAGSVLVKEEKLKNFYGVDEVYDLAWAHAQVLKGYFFGNDPAKIEHSNFVFYKKGKRHWLMPHVWVYAKIDGTWKELDALASLDAQIDPELSLASNPIDSKIEEYLFEKDQNDKFIKSETLIDQLMRESKIQNPIGKTSLGNVVSDHELKIPFGNIGTSSCVRALKTSLPEDYEFKTLVSVYPKNNPNIKIFNVSLPYAKGKQDVLHLIHSNGLKTDGAAGNGTLQLKLGSQTIAQGNAAIDDDIEIEHAVQEPIAYGGEKESRITPEVKVGGVQTIFHQITPATQRDLEDEIEKVLALKNATKSLQVPRLLRLAQVLASVKSTEMDRDIRLLRGVAQSSTNLMVAQSLEGAITLNNSLDIATIPLGATLDWKITGPVYSTFGNHREIEDYENIVQAKRETILSASHLEAQIWMDLFAMDGVNSVGALQRVAEQNANIENGWVPLLPNNELSQLNPQLSNLSLSENQFENTIAELSSDYAQHHAILSSYKNEGAVLFAAKNKIKLASGWEGFAFIVLPTQPLGSGGAYIAVNDARALLGWYLYSEGYTTSCCTNIDRCYAELGYGTTLCSEITAVYQCTGPGNTPCVTRISESIPVGESPLLIVRLAFYVFDPNIPPTVLPPPSLPPWDAFDPGPRPSPSPSPSTPPSPSPSPSPSAPPTPIIPIEAVFGNDSSDLELVSNFGTPTNTSETLGCSVGQPVNLANGIMWHEFVDFKVKGKTPNTSLNFKRTYVSKTTGGEGYFGKNFWSILDTQIQVKSTTNYSSQDLIWMDDSGGAWVFTRNSDGTLSSPKNTANILTETSTSFTLKRQNGTKWIFNKIDVAIPFGRLIKIIDPHGQEMRFNYDSVTKKLTSIEEDFFGVISLTLNGDSQVTRILRERDNLDYTFEYNSDKRLIKSRDFENHETQYGYQEQGLLASITDPLNRTIEFSYYDNGRSYTQKEPGNAKRTFFYAINSQTQKPYTRVTDLTGNAMELRFDKSERMIETIYADGSRTQNNWNTNNQLISQIDELGYKTDYSYDNFGNVTGLKKPEDSLQTEFEYEPTFNVLKRLKPLAGSEWNFTIDPQKGDILQIKRQDNSGDVKLDLTYDSAGNVVQTQNGLATYSTPHDSIFGQVNQIKRDRNITESRQYDNRGRLVRVSLSSGRVLDFTYDNFDRVVEVNNSHGPSLQMQYDAVGRLILRKQIADGSEQVESFIYDSRDRLVEYQDALGKLTRITYDAVKLGCRTRDLPRIVTDSAGRVTRYEYDSRQRLVETKDAKGGVTRYEYNARGDLIGLTDPENNRTKFFYDGNKRLIKKEIGSEVAVYFYDLSGKLIKQERSAGGVKFVTEYAYNELDRLISKTLKKMNGVTVLETQDQSQYAYLRVLDAERITNAFNQNAYQTFTWDSEPPFALKSQTEGNTQDISRVLGNSDESYQDNLMNQLVLRRVYDQAERLSTIEAQGLNVNMSFDGFGRLIGTNASTGLLQSYSYNSVNQMTAWNAVGSDGVENLNLNGLLSYGTSTGNIEQLKREFGLINNTYDVLDQLTGSQYISSMSAVSSLDRSMQYDYNGNRVQDSILGTIKVSNNVPTQDHFYGYGYDSFNNQERVYKRSSGKTLRSITYRGDDLINSTQTSKVTAKYFYDALGRRVKKEITNAGGTFTQSFEYMGTTNQVLRAKSGDATQFVYLAGDSLGQYYGHVTQNESKAYAKDHLGSALNSDVSQNKTYGSFGETQTTIKINVTTNPFISSFAMMSTDLESNLHATPNRMYDPNQGRWLTKDPIGFAGQDANLYRYVYNSPQMYTDQNGLYPDDPAYIPGRAGTEGVEENAYEQGLALGATAAVVVGTSAIIATPYLPELVNNRYIRVGEGKFPEPFSKRISLGSQKGNKIELGISKDGKVDFKIGNSRFNIREGNKNSCGGNDL